MTDDCRLPTDDWLIDAAHFPGGHATGLVFPRTTADVVDVLASSASVLAVGAQSSLTGGATPMGEVILATTKMTGIVDVRPGRITVEPGVTIAAMQERLGEAGAWFPPAPTFTGACAGGIVATNAAGAATFKYGSTRDWVEALTVVLADGTMLELARGTRYAINGRFEVETTRGRVGVPVPTYQMPQVAKRSAGYHAAPGMDLDRSLHRIRRHARRHHPDHIQNAVSGAECGPRLDPVHVGAAGPRARQGAARCLDGDVAIRHAGRHRRVRDRAHGSPIARDREGRRRRLAE